MSLERGKLMSIKEESRRQVLSTLIMSALLRWETAVTVLITMILYLFVGHMNIAGITWQPWFWLVLGALAEGALVISTITDPEEAQEALSRDFESRYQIDHIRNRVSRERLKSAMEYRRNMLKLVKRHGGAMKLHLRQTVDDINEWIGHMYNLAEHIDASEGNEIVDRDLKEVPQKIVKVRQRIDLEKDERVKQDLAAQLKQLEQQRVNLEATVNSAKRAEIQLESTLSSLGTIYAQMSLLGTKEVDGSRYQRLRDEIQDEVANLQDTIEAMNEVQTQTRRLEA
jgi:hypothetical protein